MDSFPEVLMSLTLSGDFFDEVACAKAIGIEPTSVFKQTKMHLLSDPLLYQQCFTYRINVPNCCSIDDALVILLGKIWKLRGEILRFSEGNRLSVGFSGYVRIDDGEESPIYEIARSTLVKIVELNADFSLAIDDFRDK